VTAPPHFGTLRIEAELVAGPWSTQYIRSASTLSCVDTRFDGDGAVARVTIPGVLQMPGSEGPHGPSPVALEVVTALTVTSLVDPAA